MSDDIRTVTLLKLADHMTSIDKTLTELNEEVGEMMQDIMRDLREETKGADDDLLQTTQKMVLERGNDL